MADIIERMTSDTEARTKARGFMCATDWQYEIGNAADGNKVFPSVRALKEHMTCWEECGIVEVEVTVIATIERPML
jgi:hypothetical protein